MKEHPQAHILRAIADGKTVECRAVRINGTKSGWFSITDDGGVHPDVAENLLNDNNTAAIKAHEFRTAE